MTNEIHVEAGLSDVIRIKTKPCTGPYVKRDAEEFWAIKLPWKELPGLEKIDHLRIARLDQHANIEIIPFRRIESINNKPLEKPKTEWQVVGSKGNTYTIRLHGGMYSCTCPGFRYRRFCHHITDIQEGRTN